MKTDKNNIKVAIVETANRTYSNGIFGYYKISFGAPIIVEEGDEARVWEDGTIETRGKIYVKGIKTIASFKVSLGFNTKAEVEKAVEVMRQNKEVFIQMLRSKKINYEAIKEMTNAL